MKNDDKNGHEFNPQSIWAYSLLIGNQSTLLLLHFLLAVIKQFTDLRYRSFFPSHRQPTNQPIHANPWSADKNRREGDSYKMVYV